MGDQKIYYLELLHASEGTLSRWSRLHLQSLAPTNPHWARVVDEKLQFSRNHKKLFIMSDSDDLLPNNVYSFQNQSTAICAKGPNINSTSINGLSFRNNILSSTRHMPRTFERQRYSELSFDQRCMSYRRETSPMSMYSDMRSRNFHNSIYNQMSSQRSMYNGRSGSPMSLRSMDSNTTTVSAADIATALKTEKFNKNDLKMIKDAYNKLMKRRVRKRIEKRRNMRVFLKGNRRKSGYDSGEQGSNSSVSSDDCRSTHSVMYRDNMSSCRSTKTDIADFKQSIRESNMYKDCTSTLRNSAFRNIIPVPPASNNRYNDQVRTQNLPIPNQKERFKNSFLLPSQRFDKSVASFPIPECDGNQVKPTSWVSQQSGQMDIQSKLRNDNCVTDSDQEEIFSEVTVRENSIHNPVLPQTKVSEKKRCLALEENECSSNKRTKLSSPEKLNKSNNITKTKSGNVLKDNKNTKEMNKNKKADDFQFLKPQFPIRKSGTSKFKDKLISKSAEPLTDSSILPQNAISKNANQIEHTSLSPENDSKTDKNIDDETMPHSNSDMSMRPSFIKRKLFSQKMDVTERKNLSSEVLNVNSPQTNVYSAIQREKNKARKVVTNQSCLNREVQDDNNLLDLIHKIVPPDQMNITNMTNKTSSKLSHEDNKNDEDDKWDVTSIISTCNKDDISETYTDEEIFHDNKKKSDIGTKATKPKKISKVINECKTLVERLLDIKDTKITKTDDQTKKPVESNTLVDNSKRIKSFWDTDFESDLESPRPKRWGEQNKDKNNHININSQQNKNKITDKHIANISNNIHDTTSVSERFKFKSTNSILENSMSNNKKYNINRNLTIKLFRVIDKKMNSNADVTLPLAKNMINKTIFNKDKQQNTDIKTKQMDIVNKIEDPHESHVNNTRKEIKKKSPPNTKLKDSKRSKIVRKEVETETANKPRVPVTQSRLKNNLQKSKLYEVPCKIDVVTAAPRPLQNPKKISCYLEQSKESIEDCEKPNLKSTKSSMKSTNTNNKGISCKGGGKQHVKNKENLEPAPVNVSELMIRTLRTRKIDLSSSLNTSSENVKNITIRGLRTRRIDLSSSINNSSLERNSSVIPKKIQNTSGTKNTKKSNRNDAKKGRQGKKFDTKS
ncbi:hypothetical protein evm_011611 [Chilo suppressalis]|nr:hypothetical protein evm_011611 [Chilo suppressalis]